MPGHKGKMPPEFEELAKNLYAFDVTELQDTDDLYYPNSFIAESLRDLSKDRKSTESCYLVNGSTAGILSAIMGLLSPGEKILIESGCHKSVHHAIELGNLDKVTLNQKKHLKGFPLPGAEDEIFEILKKETDIKMVFLTRPNYYGYVSDIKKIVDYCNQHHIYTVVDEAHGSHFVYHNDFPLSAMELGCSISINSFHKTMPSFTQTAVLNLGRLTAEERIQVKSMLQKLQTSSPSFLFVASLDLSFRYMEKYAENFTTLKEEIDLFHEKMKSHPMISTNRDINQDFTRILLFPQGGTSNLLTYLEDKGIYAEMHDETTIILISTIMDTRKDIDYLYRILKKFKGEQYTISPEIISSHNNSLPIADCLGKKLLEDIYIYPPGSLFLEKGTLLKEDHIQTLLNMRKEKIRFHKSVSILDDLLYVDIDI